MNARIRVALILVLLVAGCGESSPTGTGAEAQSPSAEAQIPQLREVSYRLVSAGLPAAVAKDRGLFLNHGVDVTTTLVGSTDTNIMAEGLIRDTYDVAILTTPAAITVIARSIEQGGTPPIAIVGDVVANMSNIVIAADSPAESIDDLIGGRIGVSSLSSSHMPVFRDYLDTRGLTIDQFMMVPVPSDQMLAALSTGDIVAFIHSEPTTSIAVDTGTARVLVPSSEMDVQGQSRTAVVASRRFLDENPEAMTRYLAALAEAAQLLNDQPADLVPFAAEFMGVDPAVAAGILDNELYRVEIDDDLQAAILGQAQTLTDQGDIERTPTAEELFDLQYLPSHQ